MRNDPFATLSGLDQKLFAPQSPTPVGEQEPSLKTIPKEDVRTEQRPSEPPHVRTSGRSSVGKKEPTFEVPDGPSKVRTVERHPYDFFCDQVLWLNRTKVDIHERYGRKITANAIVQLAVDLLMRDYRQRKVRSHLMTHLVFRNQASERSDEPMEGGPNGGASERPEEGS